MYKIYLSVASVLALSSCKNIPDSNWSNDCEKYSSYDSREKDQCLKRVATQTSTVNVDPENQDRAGEQDLGKKNAH